MSSEVERVNAAWDSIEKHFAEKKPDYKLPAGAAAADIAALETLLKFSLPEEFKVSLRRHNGAEEWTKGKLLHSIESLKGDWGELAGLVDDGGWEESPEGNNEFIQKTFFDKKWIPFDANPETGHVSYIDLNPGTKGKVGQIIKLDPMSGAQGPLFSDFAAYLEDAASLLESGK